MRPWYIYALSDPVTKEIKYVGRTFNLKKRMANHVNNNNGGGARRSKWISSLASSGLKPSFQILEQGTGDYNAAEKIWIWAMRSLGFKLTNHSDGGTSGNVELRWSPERRAEWSKRMTGTKFSEAARRNLSAAKKGIPLGPPSDETRAKQSKARLGIRYSQETIDKMRSAQKGKTLSLETISKIRLALLRRPLATHCKNGHELTPENTRLRIRKEPEGNQRQERVCRACHREQEELRWVTKRAHMARKSRERQALYRARKKLHNHEEAGQ